MKKNIKIAIVKLSALGDIVHTMVVLEFIKKAYPTIQIDWIVEKSFQDILKNNPNITNILPIELKSIKQNKKNIFGQIKLIKKYSQNNYDIIIDAQGLIKSSLVSKILNPKQIVGFSKDSIKESIASIFYTKHISIGYEQNIIKRNIKLINKALDLNITDNNILEKKPFLYSSSTLVLPAYEILFVIGASKPNKIYPKERFLNLAQKLKKNILVIWGNEKEYQDALWLTQQSSFCILDTKSSLNELKYKIINAKLVIGADTGPTHMAWGLNIPSITIFGNTPAYRNSYETSINKTIKSNSIVNPLKLDKDDFSIKDIDEDDILKLALELL